MTKNTTDFRQAIEDFVSGRDHLEGNVDQGLLTDSGVKLHLRSLNLLPADIDGLLDCFDAFPEQANQIESFSLSYNPLGDEGVMQLLERIPPSVNTLGLVRCGITDKGGKAIIGWMRTVSNVRMVCIENNAYSIAMERAFKVYRRSHPTVLLVS